MVYYWPEQRAERLRELWRLGLSVDKIAAEIGGITRNAVIGKAHRLGLDVLYPRRPRTGPSARVKTTRDKTAVVQPQQGAVHAANNFTSQNLTLMQLEASSCRWPVDGSEAAGFFFCGAQVSGKFPYCEYHVGFAHQPSAPTSERSEARARYYFGYRK